MGMLWCILSFLLLSLAASVYGDEDVVKQEELKYKINLCLKEATRVNDTLKETFKVSDFQKWLSDIQNLKIKDKIEGLHAQYNELQYRFNKTGDLLRNLVSDWEGKITEDQVQQTGSKIQQFQESLDIISNKVVNQSGSSEEIQNEYRNLDVLVRTHETRYPNFENRILDLQNKSQDIQEMEETHEDKCKEVRRLINLNKQDKERMRLEAEIMSAKHQTLKQKIQQLEADIRALKEVGVEAVAPQDEFVATDRARGKGKNIRLVLIT